MPACRKSELQCICDDTILNSFGTDVDEVNSSLQLALNSVKNWYSSNLLSLSKEKSATLLVRGNKRNEPGDLNVTLGGHPLKQERSMKYLGVYLDQNLSWNEQCDKLCVHIAGKLAVLRRIRSFVKPDLQKLLFEKTIQPVFDYACTVWGNTSQGNTVEPLYNTIVFHQNTHKRHPIARP